MTERDDSHELAALEQRLKASREGFARLPVLSDRRSGPTDPSTGESWHRGNVLGHVSEMLPYWTEQIRAAVAGSGKVGRDPEGAKRRRQGIDEGDAASEDEVRRAIDDGIANVLELMAVMSPGDLERVVVFHSRAGDRDARLGKLLQTLVVVHLEDHLAQLAELS